MKKLFLLLIFSFALHVYGQDSDATLTTQSNVIRNETSARANTKGRIADMFQALIDSKLSRVDNAADTLGMTTASTASSTITLDLDSKKQRMFDGSATFSTAKTIAFSNTTNAHVFSFTFEITNVAAVLTLPSSVIMSNGDFDGDDWTPPSTGKYKMGGTFDGSEWWVEIAGPYQ